MPEFVVPSEDDGRRTDVFVARVMDLSRSRAAKLIEDRFVTVNGQPAKPGRMLKRGETVRVETPPQTRTELEPEPLAFDVLYQDAYLLVLNKPRGLVVHPAAGHWSGTLVHGLLARGVRLSATGGPERPGIVHRLDRHTSGLMLVATEDRTHRALQAQIQSHTVHREYAALVWGDPPFAEATIDAAIGRHPVDRKKMAVLPHGSAGARGARTDIAVVERFGPVTLVHARLHTGRTHQIRVHCAYAGHPVVGDPVYGSGRILPRVLQSDEAAPVRRAVEQLSGQALHAMRLRFVHPVSNQPMEFRAPLPDDMQAILDALRHLVYRRSCGQL